MKFSENKIIFSNNVFLTIKEIKSENEQIILTPFTKMADIFALKSKSVLWEIIKQKISDMDSKLVDDNEVCLLVNELNKIVGFQLFDSEIPLEKIIKLIFIINEDLILNENMIWEYIKILNKYSKKNKTLILTGWTLNLYNKISEFNNVIIIVVTNSLINNIISWKNLESLVIHQNNEFIEFIDKEKFLSYVEYKSKTVLTISDINNYFSGKICLNSFIIDRSIKTIE